MHESKHHDLSSSLSSPLQLNYKMAIDDCKDERVFSVQRRARQLANIALLMAQQTQVLQENE